MPKRGRTKGFVMSDEHRTKIQNSKILQYLMEHALGQRGMEQSQVTTGIALIKKVLPDLQALTISGDKDNPIGHFHTLTWLPPTKR